MFAFKCISYIARIQYFHFRRDVVLEKHVVFEEKICEYVKGHGEVMIERRSEFLPLCELYSDIKRLVK